MDNVKGFRWLAARIGAGSVGPSPATEPPGSPAPEQAVIVHFQYGSTDLARLFALEQELESAISAAAAGEYDGNEVATDGRTAIYTCTADADRLFEAIRSILESASFMRGAEIRIRYGPPADGVREQVVSIAP